MVGLVRAALRMEIITGSITMALEKVEPTVHQQDDAPPTVALPEGVLIGLARRLRGEIEQVKSTTTGCAYSRDHEYDHRFIDQSALQWLASN